jgi:hypothetical protein
VKGNPDLQGISILVMDGRQSFREETAQALSRFGAEVHTARNMQEGGGLHKKAQEGKPRRPLFFFNDTATTEIYT